MSILPKNGWLVFAETFCPLLFAQVGGSLPEKTVQSLPWETKAPKPRSALEYIRRSAPRYFLVCGLAQVKCLSQGSPLKHDGRRKTTKRKKRAKGFQGFLYGTSGGRNSKGSSPGPPGRKNKNKNFKKIKTGTYH